MNGLQILYDRFWVTKEKDRDLYDRVRDELDIVRDFARECTGWNVIANEKLIKLEKIPDRAAPYMGITDFTEIKDYVFLCVLLIFLEDLEDGEAFLLSEYIDNIDVVLSEHKRPDWTSFSTRKSLIRAMKFAESEALILRHEGDLSGVENDIGHEVLYENTGNSRYFSVNFLKDVSSYRSYEDFEERPEETDIEIGHNRTNRVYRNLTMTPAVYWEGTKNPDSTYIKNQRNAISKNLCEGFGSRLDIHNGAAFMMLDEGNTFGGSFPKDNTLSDMVLLMCKEIRKKISVENMIISREDFLGMVSGISGKYRSAWSREYRDMTELKIAAVLLREMCLLSMTEETSEGIRILQGAYKFSGNYPKDFDPRKPEEWKEKSIDKKTMREEYSQITMVFND